MQNHFLASLILVVLIMAAQGWLFDLLHKHRGPHAEKLFRARLAWILSGVFLFIILSVNYFLASTGLQRSMASEKVPSKDCISWFLFGGANMRSNHLFAIPIVLTSFVAAAGLIKATGRLVDAWRHNGWVQDRKEYVLIVAKCLLAAAAAIVVLLVDTFFLVFRTACLLWPETIDTNPADLANLMGLLRQHPGTMGESALLLLACWYPVSILLAESWFASASAHCSEATRNRVAENVPVVQAIPTPPVVAPQPAPGAPQANQPRVVPVTPPAPGAVPVPGGPEDWNRPVPVNAGPQGENNGHH